MNITRLRLENFKRHAQLEVDFAPGLNIVRGANEAGKTTIQQALEMVLFRRPTSSSQDLDDARPWSDVEADPVVQIEFDNDGMHGSLRKMFAGQRGTVGMRVGDETLTDPAAVDARVAVLTGLPSEKFFRATASVRHQELGGLDHDESTLRDRLQQSMSGADRGTHAARRKLEEAIRRYRSEGAKNPGYLKVMRADVDRLRERVTEGETALAGLETDRQNLGEARAARVALDADLAEHRAAVADAERGSILEAKLNDASRRYATYRRAVELREEIRRLEASHPSPVDLASLRLTVDKLRNEEFDIAEMRAELAAEPDLSGYELLEVPRSRMWAFLAGLFLVGAAGAAVFAVAGQSLLIGLAIAVVLGAVGAFFVRRTIEMRRRVNDIQLQNELRESEIARRLAGRTDLAERVRQAEQERADALATLRVVDVARADALVVAETEHLSAIANRNGEYRGLMGDDAAEEDIVALRDAAAAEADECRHALAGLGEIGVESQKQLVAFKLAIQRLTPQREAALLAEAQADARVAANETDADKVAADAEALGAAAESLAAAERRLRIYEDVLATLNKSEQATMKKAARFLEQRMARDVERITGGRYRRLSVDEATLTFTVYSPESNDWIDVRQLSQGTLDQLYLCARLGIVRQVTQPANPPLIFDDPFITFDDERARRALALLKDISREHQVIYLTTSDRYDAMADKVVELTAPTERDEPEPVATPAQPVETLSMWQETMLPAPVAKQRPPANDPAVGTTNGAGTAAANGNGHKPVDGEPDLAPLWPVEER